VGRCHARTATPPLPLWDHQRASPATPPHPRIGVSSVTFTPFPPPRKRRRRKKKRRKERKKKEEKKKEAFADNDILRRKKEEKVSRKEKKARKPEGESNPGRRDQKAGV